ncbi:MAG TPA: DUF2071 domain-containing protein [Candidatus Limnocylindria bacterium]|nr:DUF2071 domain-containing protein [Candidatus Limnocylindria bacterium]
MTLHLLRRHPFAIAAHFDFSLVLTYALPAIVLEAMIPPGLALDRNGKLGFLAIAMVQTRDLRPGGWPAGTGRDFFLTGYRVFTRLAAKPSLRGLRILRSDADSPLMVVVGNIFTRYGYSLCRVKQRRSDGVLSLEVTTRGRVADLSLRVRLDDPEAPPLGSPFADLAQARRYAGPLPYTFDYEPETRSIVVVRATRGRWSPRPVTVERVRLAFLARPPFAGARPVLAGAFIVEDVAYRWERGYRERVPG